MHRIRIFATALLLAGLCFGAIVSSALAAKSDNKDREVSPAGTTEAGKRQSFRIGAKSGFYEKWNLEGLTGFDGVSMTIKVDKIDREGKGKHTKWASGFRLILDPEKPSDEKEWSRYILAFVADPDGKVLYTQNIVDGVTSDLGVELDADQPISISVLPVDDEFILVKINEKSFRQGINFKIRHIAASSSGMFISTDNFQLLPIAK